MRVKLADRIGFCFGVKRAINTAEEALKKKERASSLGSIIHNTQVVEALARKGLKIIKDIDEAQGAPVLISSHGAPPEVFNRIKEKGLDIIDTTCPFVLHAQRLASQMVEEGYTIVIVGEETHPEVKAIAGFSLNKAIVVKDKSDPKLKDLSGGKKVAIISQTTQRINNFLDVVGAIVACGPKEVRVFNTICSDTGRRQKAAADLAKTVDIMIVIGGRHSANTNRLLEVCGNFTDSYLVETDEDVRSEWFRGKRCAGIASGASTPDWVIEKVVRKIEKFKAQGAKRKVKSKNPMERGCVVNDKRRG